MRIFWPVSGDRAWEGDWISHGQPAETDMTQRTQKAEPAHPNIAGAKCGERLAVVIERSFVCPQTPAEWSRSLPNMNCTNVKHFH